MDAKSSDSKFTGQLEDYLKLEKNPNNIGFKYNGTKFECYIKGVLEKNELTPHNADYYINKYFKDARSTLPEAVSNFARKLANDFRDSNVDKQNNVPFIGAVMLCLKYCSNFAHEILSNTSKKILLNIKNAINKYIDDIPFNKKQKKEKIKVILDDQSLNNIEYSNLINIISDITNIWNFINIDDNSGHDTMNGFLKIFRKWNSVNAKEKGEVFTPDHIARLMYYLANCNSESCILDPTCGSGTFLLISMINMIKNIKNDKDYEIKKKRILENNLIGIENSMFNATLASINMMLHGDGSSNIYKDDCFNKLPDIQNTYDRVLMNPPFSQNIKELKFVLESLNFMKEGGICCAIVPVSSVLSQRISKNGCIPEDTKYKKEILEKHNLLGVVRLPKKLFHPNASVQTCIIIVQAHTKYNHATWRKNFLDDGYIEARNVGRIDHHSEEALNIFLNQKPEIVDLTEFDDWPKYDDVDFKSVSKLDFMRQKLDFMRQKLDFIITTNKLEDLLINNNGILDLQTINVSNKEFDFSQWKLFNINKLFKIENGKDKSDENNPDNKNGYIPLVIASSNYNGIGYYIKQSKKIFSKNCISLVNQGDGASGIAKAHNYDFAATSSVSVLSNKNLNPWINIFISTVLSKLHDLFDFTYSMNESRLNKVQLFLPAKNGDPDWEYMEKYIKNEL